MDMYTSSGEFTTHFSDAKVLHPEVIRFMDYFVTNYSVFASGETYFITLSLTDYHKALQKHRYKS